MKKAIIIGASSGIGAALARQLASEGYQLGLAARRYPLLLALQQELGPQTRIRQIDVAQTDHAIHQCSALIEEMGSVELIVISAGIGFINPDLDWQKEHDTIAVNVTGFVAIANIAMHHFQQQGSGHLVNISSIAALRGSGSAPAYNASKAFESNYMGGLRQKVIKLGLPITITDIQPGFVDTAMAQAENLFWVASPQKAAQQINQAIQKKKNHAYITQRWALFAWLMKLLPDFLYNRL